MSQWWQNRPEEDHRPPPARGKASRRGFGRTWWGTAWVEALEERAGLDTGRLSRGRSYARRGAVAGLRLTSGVVFATVQGTRVTPYTVTVRVPRFSDEQWERLLDVVGARLGNTAALLDGELSPDVAADCAAAGLDLLPGAGEVTPSCSCPDWGEPCKHAAAVCYLVADALDDDPFALLRLRGRGRGEILEALRSRRTTDGATPAAEPSTPRPDGVPAKAAYAVDVAHLPEPPHPPLPPSHVGTPPTLAQDPPPESGLDAANLHALAADAATRAWRLATGAADHGLGLSFDEDLARRAAELLDTPALAELASRAGLSSRELTGWALAWKHGGAVGLSVSREPFRPPAGAMAAARAAIADRLTTESGQAPDPTAVRLHHNRASYGRHQLRLGPDGLWYPYVRAFGAWDPSGPPSPDPGAALG